MGSGCSSSQPNTKANVIKVIGKKVDVKAMEKEYVRGDNVETMENPEALQAFFDEIAMGEKWDPATKAELRKKLWPEPVSDLKMLPTNVPSVDDLFNSIAKPMNQIIHMRDDLQTAIDNIKQVSRILAKGTRVVNLKGALNVLLVTAAGSFSLTVSLEPLEVDIVIGKECKGDIYEAVIALKNLGIAAHRIATQLPPLADNVQALIPKCKQAPDQIKEDAPAAGLNPFETMKAGKNATTNVMTLSKFPQVIADLIALGKSVLNDLKNMNS